MNIMHFVGMDLHKKFVQFCRKDAAGTVLEKGSVKARPAELWAWAERLPKPWVGGMEATMFTHWIYDLLLPLAERLEVGNPVMMKAIYAGKHKNDALNAEQIADLLRANLMPRVHPIPAELRPLRDTLRYRLHVLRNLVKQKNRVAGLLMQYGVEYEKSKLHRQGYFTELRQQLDPDMPPLINRLLDCGRQQIDELSAMSEKLIRCLEQHPAIKDRVAHLRKIDGVGEITALTWVLEIGDIRRIHSIDNAISYCGLCSAEVESAGKTRRGPLSKQRNPYLQRVLIEAGHLAPRYNDNLKAVSDKAFQRFNDRNLAALETARKLVAYLVAADRQFHQPKSVAVAAPAEEPAHA